MCQCIIAFGGLLFSTDGFLICGPQRHSNHNACIIEESSAGLVLFQVYELNRRENRIHVCEKWTSGIRFSSRTGDVSTPSHHGPMISEIPY